VFWQRIRILDAHASTRRAGKVVLLLLVLTALVAGYVAVAYTAYTLGRSSPAPAEDDNALTAADDTSRPVKALGKLEPEGEVITIGIPGADRLEAVHVKEGDEVEKGQELARLQSHSDRLAERELAASQLEEARQRLAATTASAEAQVQEARLQVRQANEVGPLDIKAQESRVGLLREQAESATRTLERLKSLGPGSVPRQEMEKHELAVRQATVELDSARTLLEKSRAALELNRLAAEAQLKTALAARERVQKEIPIASLEKSLQVADERLRGTVIRAPAAGRVLRVLSLPGEVVGAQPILQMGDTRRMVAVAEVYETDVGRVREGQRALVTSPALPPGGLRGTVVQVGSMVGRNLVYDLDPAAAVDRRVVEVKVLLDQSEVAARRINLQVHVTITPSEQGTAKSP
jgi:HlyD family secretion protein